MTNTTEPTTVILFDDERSFKPGFRDNAIVLRTVFEAEQFFENNKGLVVDELWLDYVLHPGDTSEAIHAFEGVTFKKIFFHSTAFGAIPIIRWKLDAVNIDTPVEDHDRSVFAPTQQ